MTRIEDLTRKLSIAAAAEGKSVTVVLHQTGVDLTKGGAPVHGLALSSAMIAMANSSMPRFDGALSTSMSKDEGGVDESV